MRYASFGQLTMTWAWIYAPVLHSLSLGGTDGVMQLSASSFFTFLQHHIVVVAFANLICTPKDMRLGIGQVNIAKLVSALGHVTFLGFVFTWRYPNIDARGNNFSFCHSVLMAASFRLQPVLSRCNVAVSLFHIWNLYIGKESLTPSTVTPLAFSGLLLCGSITCVIPVNLWYGGRSQFCLVALSIYANDGLSLSLAPSATGY